MTSFVAVAKTLGQARETAQRQLNAETKKRKEGARIESLNKQLSEKHEKITMVEEMMRRIFTGFVSCILSPDDDGFYLLWAESFSAVVPQVPSILEVS